MRLTIQEFPMYYSGLIHELVICDSGSSGLLLSFFVYSYSWLIESSRLMQKTDIYIYRRNGARRISVGVCQCVLFYKHLGKEQTPDAFETWKRKHIYKH